MPLRPSTNPGRNGILAADLALTGGDNQCAIWRGFAKRGLGFSASQGTNTSATDGTEAFDLPTICTATFGGFRPPIVGRPAINTVDAGDSVPVKFTLAGASGPIDAATVFASQQIDCTTNVPSGAIVPARVPGSRELRAVDGVYHFNWKTEASWSGTCRQLLVRLQDVTGPIAYFRFE